MTDLLAAAVRLLHRRPGATMAEIAEAAGISRATLHRRFPSREALLAEAAAEAATAAEAAVRAADPGTGPAVDACRRLLAELVPLGGRFAFLLREGAWLDELPAVATVTARVESELTALVDRGRRTGELRLDLPASYQVRLVLTAVWTAWEAVEAGELGSREAPAAAAAALLAGIADA